MILVINEIIFKNFQTAGLVMPEKEKQYHEHMLSNKEGGKSANIYLLV